MVQIPVALETRSLLSRRGSELSDEKKSRRRMSSPVFLSFLELSGVFHFIRLDILDCFLHVNKGQKDQAHHKKENQREDGGAQAAEDRFHQPEQKRPGPGSAALADLVKRVELGLLAGGDDLGIKASADSLGGAPHAGQ